jgi:hypothetical protein
MDVCGVLAFRQQDVIQPRTGLDHLNDVAAAPGGAKTVDADGDAAAAPIELIDRRDGVLPRLRLELRDHGVFEVEEDGVGWSFGGLFHEARRGRGNGQQRSIGGVSGHEYLMFGLVTASSALNSF